MTTAKSNVAYKVSLTMRITRTLKNNFVHYNFYEYNFCVFSRTAAIILKHKDCQEIK